MTEQDKLVTLEIVDLAYDGKSVAHCDGKVVFLKGGLPGEIVEAEIVQSRRRYDKALVHRIIKKSEHRIDARCSHFGQCGGCTWQDLEYEQQLLVKRKQVVDCLERLGGFDDIEVAPILGVEDPFWYRNKMEYSFHVDDNDSLCLGLHERGRFDQIFDLSKCYLQSELSNQVVACVRSFAVENNISAYNVKTHEGYLRFLVIRETARTDQLMVNLVTNHGDFPDVDKLLDELTSTVPQITTIVHNRTGKVSNIAVGETEEILFGPGYIEEELSGRRFVIRANSFFQTNSLQAEKLYDIAFEMLDPQPDEQVLDLFCGAGTIGILLADKVAEVLGVELVEDAVQAASRNAELNNIENITFFCGQVRDFLKQTPAEQLGQPTVIVDPPRAGLHPKAMKRIIEMQPEKLLYISCNPATFARDAKLLAEGGYTLPLVRPVDMFPHTMHIELVGRFYRRRD
jgi:23S rRNA (uracil1939-C5)-methyltransferase